MIHPLTLGDKNKGIGGDGVGAILSLHGHKKTARGGFY